LSVFFGLQAAGAYIVLGWLPQIFRDAGVAPATAGLLLALTPAVGIPLAFLMPTLAARLPTQGPLAVALSALGIAGYLGLWFVPATLPWLWALLLGVSQASFPLALTMIGLRSRSTRGVAQLSAFAQGVGYLISIPGPILVGVLYDHTAGWTAPLAFMAALLVPQAVAGVLAGRDRFVESETVRA
jgi:CP family cyanate transporter-like MFS transporter